MGFRSGPNKDVLRHQPIDDLPASMQGLPAALDQIVDRAVAKSLAYYLPLLIDRSVRDAVRGELDRREEANGRTG